MSVGRRCVPLLLALATPATAWGQTEATPVRTPARPGDVVVSGVVDRKPGNWKRAEAEHVVVSGTNSADELIRVATNLERLYALMSRLYRRGAQGDDTLKLQVVLIDSSAGFEAMGLRNIRWEQGPFMPVFTDRTYYDPREDGEIVSIARSEQILDLNTVRARNLDCDDLLAEGAETCASLNQATHGPAIRTWEDLLYSAFAERFILTYDPAAYPAWYLDGIGALFSTITIRRDGAIDYARSPAELSQFLRSYGTLNVGDVLTGRYLDSPPKQSGWTPYHAWMLAHYFLFSKLNPERARQFQLYMTAVHQGVPMAEAAKVFGDMRALQRDFFHYTGSDKKYAYGTPPQEPVAEPVVTSLSASASALVEARIELGPRIAALTPDASPAEIQRTADWLDRIRGVADERYDADAILFAAEAECRAGSPDACLADAERVLARSPDDVRALAWKGMALTRQAVSGAAADRTAKLASARTAIARAIALDGQAPLPQIALFESFTRAGQPAPETALRGMAQVIRSVPAAPAPRLDLARELLRQGQPDLALRVVYTVLHGPYNSPEKRAAEALFAAANGPRPSAPAL